MGEKLPAIDFNSYKGRVNQAVLDDFQKKYSGLEVPYPKDTVASTIASHAAEQKSAYEKFLKESQGRVTGFSTELAKWEAMMPVEEITWRRPCRLCLIFALRSTRRSHNSSP